MADDASGTRVAQPMFQEASTLGCLVKDKDGVDLVQISATEDFTFGAFQTLSLPHRNVIIRAYRCYHADIGVY
jgi:hypothetical protein